ncbi:MFS transporter [Novosphingobium sp. FSY-8]|uniref:MFS transporter n=1 Tax=Novosphingobium ovatum TaxID=1908523 RepID=A0ABW9XDC5_9SPHN|nr:MFS transporter [Novosphingobium ovatum]NBC36546.1 MFS transporter [Novosphingobium ovatum]
MSVSAPDARWSRQAMAIVALCFALNMADGMDLLVLSFIAPTLQTQWSVSATQMAMVFSSGLAGMAAGGLALAPLADRIGRRRMVALAMGLMAAAMALSSMTRSVGELAAVRFFVGVGIGTVLACIASIAARVAPMRHRNFAVGVLQAGYPIGAMLTGFATAWALPLFGWQAILMATAGVSGALVLAVVMLLPADLDADIRAHAAPLREVIAGPRRANTIRLWVAAICGFMALYFITSWITKLAIEAGLPQTQAIIASAIYNFGAFAGTLGMSILGNRTDVRRLASVLLIATSGVFLFFGGVAMPLWGVLATAFVMGVTLQGGFNMLYPLAAQVYPDAVRATGIGWVFGIGRIGAFTGPLLGGWALGMHWPLVAVFGLFCAPLLIAAMAAALVRPQA